MVSLNEIIKYLEEHGIAYKYYGDNNCSVEGFSSLNKYKENTITWCKNSKYIPNEDKTYKLVICSKDLKEYFNNCICVGDSKNVFFSIVDYFWGEDVQSSSIGEGTYISENVSVGKNVIIGHNCVLDGDIIIGDNSRIFNNVVMVNKICIGEKCIIHSGTVLGHDDFSYTEDTNHNKKMIKHYGGVDIGANVFIGSNCVINRGTIDDTIVKDGAKIDAFCHISHNCVVGKNCSLISGTRLYGSTTVNDNAYIASAIVKNQLSIGDNSIVGMGSVVLDDVEDNIVVAGIPAKRIK